MLINILYLIIGIALTLVWIKVIKQKTPLNFQEIVKDKFWLIITGSLIVAIGYLYFYLPQVFEWLAVEFWGVPSSTITEDGKTKVLQLTDLGPLGDIYGSLNTLFTSATLAFVVYATLLQRQANNDAREAMERQLQQAKEDTEEQLKQAREATEQQILNAQQLAHIQLEHARQYSMDQLALAKATHDAQIKESKDAIFSNMFYALLSQKQQHFNNLKFTFNDVHTLTASEILYNMSTEFFSLLKSEWLDLNILTKEKVRDDFNQALKKLNNNKTSSDFYSYFGYYRALLNLIERYETSDQDKQFFWDLLSVSTSATEKLLLFWLAIFQEGLKEKLIETKFLDFKLNENMLPLAIKFFDKSYFKDPFV